MCGGVCVYDLREHDARDFLGTIEGYVCVLCVCVYNLREQDARDFLGTIKCCVCGWVGGCVRVCVCVYVCTTFVSRMRVNFWEQSRYVWGGGWCRGGGRPS